MILALICIGTSCASCGGKNSGGGLIPEPDKSQIIGVGAKIYVFGDDVSGIGEKTNFTIDKTTNSTQEFISALKDLYALENVRFPSLEFKFCYSHKKTRQTRGLSCFLAEKERFEGLCPHSRRVS